MPSCITACGNATALTIKFILNWDNYLFVYEPKVRNNCLCLMSEAEYTCSVWYLTRDMSEVVKIIWKLALESWTCWIRLATCKLNNLTDENSRFEIGICTVGQSTKSEVRLRLTYKYKRGM